MKIETTPEFEKSLKRLVLRERFALINPAEYWRKTKWFIQRGRRGYCDADIWNANDHIARTVLAFLEHNTTCKMAGYPADLTPRKWSFIQKEIRWLMEEHLELHDTPIEVLTTKRYRDRYKRANKYFGQYWGALWD